MKAGNRIDYTFARLAREKRKALIGYLTAGYPSKAAFLKLVPSLSRAGLDLLEIGIPFSDPIADGPTIQHSSQVALDRGVTLRWVLQSVTALRSQVSIPFIFMSYSNPIIAMGIDAFFRSAARAGVDGIIIPDLIPEEGSAFESAAGRCGIHVIYLVSPTTPAARIQAIARRTRGFLYVVALSGVTGVRARLGAGLPRFVSHVRRLSACPLAVGFGLSTPAQVVEAARQADGVIVGSALIKSITASNTPAFQRAATFVKSLRRALDRRYPAPKKGASYAA